MKKTKKTKQSKKRSSGRTARPVRPVVNAEASPKTAAPGAATDAPVPSTSPEFKAGKDL
jgi:hypothetical protein